MPALVRECSGGSLPGRLRCEPFEAVPRFLVGSVGSPAARPDEAHDQRRAGPVPGFESSAGFNRQLSIWAAG